MACPPPSSPAPPAASDSHWPAPSPSARWRLVIDAREAGPLHDAAAELAQLTDVAALAGDVADPEHRAALIAAAGDAVDLLVNNASVLGPSPQPALADYPLDVLEHVYRVNVLAPLALIQLALPRRRAADRQRLLRRRRRGLRGLGRLRLRQGRARPPHRDPRRRAPRPARLRRRPRRHEHPHAPGGVPRRGHLRPAAARRPSVPGLLALIEGDLPSGRYQAAGCGCPA